MEELDGPQFFLRFAWPCAENKLNAKKITNEEFFALGLLITQKLTPEIEFLEHCFPDATKHLKNWSREEVADYWHNRHGHEGDCAIKIATIKDLIDLKIVLVLCENNFFTAINFYDLNLQVDAEVYLHHRVIIEKVNRGAIAR